jgi:hypothetical protein
MNAIAEDDDIWSVDHNDGEHMEIENVPPGCIFELPSSLMKTASTRRRLKVDFGIINIDVIEAPQYVADACRATSISNVLPLSGVISEWWSRVQYPHTSRIAPPGPKYNYATHRDAHASARSGQHYNHALALRSAIIMALNRALILQRTLCGPNTWIRATSDHSDGVHFSIV